MRCYVWHRQVYEAHPDRRRRLADRYRRLPRPHRKWQLPWQPGLQNVNRKFFFSALSKREKKSFMAAPVGAVYLKCKSSFHD